MLHVDFVQFTAKNVDPRQAKSYFLRHIFLWDTVLIETSTQLHL